MFFLRLKIAIQALRVSFRAKKIKIIKTDDTMAMYSIRIYYVHKKIVG